jgi:hypothetical protein
MEIISRISKGSRMDQIYIPKNRTGFNIGNYVIIKPIGEDEKPEKESKKRNKKLYFYGVNKLVKIKLEVIHKMIGIIEKNAEFENLIFTGSFLEKGFDFKDIDVLIISKARINKDNLKKIITEEIGIKPDIVVLNNKTLMKGLSTDPLYQMMLSKCVSIKRLISNARIKINYKILDLHLLKSKTLIDNFDFLNGNEKYQLMRNVIAIYLFLKKKKITKDSVDKKIKKFFKLDVDDIKQNLINKSEFLKTYKKIYKETFEKIMKGVGKEYGSKQK